MSHGGTPTRKGDQALSGAGSSAVTPQRWSSGPSPFAPRLELWRYPLSVLNERGMTATAAMVPSLGVGPRLRPSEGRVISISLRRQIQTCFGPSPK